jgi:hypothetical protein
VTRPKQLEFHLTQGPEGRQLVVRQAKRRGRKRRVATVPIKPGERMGDAIKAFAKKQGTESGKE